MDDKLPRCGCGGTPRHGIFEEGMPGLTCDKCSIAIVRNTEADAEAAWTRAMSSPAPGMEAMMNRVLAEWDADIARMEDMKSRGDLTKDYGEHSLSLTWQHANELRAALQAAERGKK